MSKVTAKAFVEAWQTSDTLDEVVEKTGLAHRQASSRAGHYRKKGVPLKKFRMTQFDWGALAELAESHGPNREHTD